MALPPTKSAEHAIEVTEQNRPELLRAGRICAIRVALSKGVFTTRDVRAAMAAEGLLPQRRAPTGQAQERWLGAVVVACRPQVFRRTGRYVPVVDRACGIHRGRDVSEWELIPGADLSAFGFSERAPFSTLDAARASGDPGPFPLCAESSARVASELGGILASCQTSPSSELAVLMRWMSTRR